jgi:hypothetical protein
LNGIKPGFGVRPQCLVKSFTLYATGLGNLCHTSGLGNVTQSRGQLTGVALLQHLAKIFRNIRIAFEVLRHIEFG